MLVTMATPISSHVKDKNSIFTARGEHDFLVKGEMLVFHQYLHNKLTLVGYEKNLSACVQRIQRALVE